MPMTIGYVLLSTFIFAIFPLAHWFSAAFSAGLLGALCLWAFVDRKFNYAVFFAVLGVSLCALGALWVLFNLNSTVGSLGSYTHIYNGSLSLWGLRITGVGSLLFALTLNPILIVAAIYGVWQVGTRPRENIGASVILVVSGLLTLTILGISLKSAVYQTRNFTWLIAPITLFSAIGIDKGFRRLSMSRIHQALAIGAVLLLSGGIALSAPRLYPLEIDDWRDAGKMIALTPGCETAEVPVWIPWLAEQPSDLFTRQTQRMYGYYAGHPERIRPLRMATLPEKGATLCPVVLWIAQMSPSEARSEGRRVLGTDADNLKKVELRGHLVFMRPTVGAGDASDARQ
jgi:hypothetical protein